MATATDYLSCYLEPIAQDLTREQAQKILSIKPAADVLARVEELGDKANEGRLTVEERAEYAYYVDVDVDDAIGLLKAKARQLLNSR